MWEDYGKRTAKGEKAGAVLDDFGVDRYCCRGMFLGQVDLIDTVAAFKKS